MNFKILISACLLGENVKYDGGNNKISDPFLEDGINRDLFIPVCPEVLGGLSVPRIPCEIINDEVRNKAGENKTLNFQNGALKALKTAKENDVRYALLKERSPSCGVCEIYDGTFTKTVIQGQGITTRLLEKNGIKCFSENQINDLLSIIKL